MSEGAYFIVLGFAISIVVIVHCMRSIRNSFLQAVLESLIATLMVFVVMVVWHAIMDGGISFSMLYVDLLLCVPLTLFLSWIVMTIVNGIGIVARKMSGTIERQ